MACQRVVSAHVLHTQQINEAEVVAVGPGRRNNVGELVPMSVKKGDKVLLPEYGGTPVKLDEKEYAQWRFPQCGLQYKSHHSFTNRMLVYREDELIGVLTA